MNNPPAPLLETARWVIERDAVPELQVATLEWDQVGKHVRLSFFIDGIPQDVDLETLDLAVGEIIGAHWQMIETGGSCYVFDRQLLAQALVAPSVVFKR